MARTASQTYLNVFAQRNENDLQEEINRGKALKSGNSFGNTPSSGSSSPGNSYNAKQDARDAMSLRREENDHNSQRDLELGERKRQGDLNRTLARDAATEAAANRQYHREKEQATALKSDIGWTR